MEELIRKAEVLVEALPYIRRFYGKIVVIKYGGSTIKGDTARTIIADIVLMRYVGMKPVLVHGGGPLISSMLEKLGKESVFHQGLRVTDEETMDVVQMVLAGKVNKDIVAVLQEMGGNAVGLSGRDGALIRVSRRKTVDEASGEEIDLGYVGKIEEVDTGLLNALLNDEFIPVIAPLGVGEDGKTYNVNADEAAGKIAGALSAEKLVFLTDVPGILDEQGKLASSLKICDAEQLMERGVIKGGMIPKVMACKEALEAGVRKTHIIDGRIKHALLLEIFTDSGIGTEIVL